MISSTNTFKKMISLIVILSGFSASAQNPPDIILVFYLDENSPNETLIGTVTATDPDQDPLTYTIVSGNDNNAFAIHSTSGDLTVNDQSLLDFETTPEFDLMVEADDGNGGMTIAGVTIRLNDIDEDALGIGDAVQLTFYPNPVEDMLVVELLNSQWKSTSIGIYAIDGELLSVKRQSLTAEKTIIDFTTLAKGIYILEIKNEAGEVFRQRIFTK